MTTLTKIPLAIGGNSFVLFAGFNQDRTKIAIIKNSCLWLRGWTAPSFAADDNGHRPAPEPSADEYYQFLNFIAHWGDEKLLSVICTGPHGEAPSEDEWTAAAILAQLPGLMNPIPLAIAFCTETVGGKRCIRIRKDVTRLNLRTLEEKFFEMFRSRPVSAFEADENYYSLEIPHAMTAASIQLFKEEVVTEA